MSVGYTCRQLRKQSAAHGLCILRRYRFVDCLARLIWWYFHFYWRHHRLKIRNRKPQLLTPQPVVGRQQRLFIGNQVANMHSLVPRKSSRGSHIPAQCHRLVKPCRLGAYSHDVRIFQRSGQRSAIHRHIHGHPRIAPIGLFIRSLDLQRRRSVVADTPPASASASATLSRPAIHKWPARERFLLRQFAAPSVRRRLCRRSQRVEVLGLVALKQQVGHTNRSRQSSIRYASAECDEAIPPAPVRRMQHCTSLQDAAS